MKRYQRSITCLVLFLGISFTTGNLCAQGNQYKISGRIAGIGNTKVYLSNKPYGFGSAFRVEVYDSCMSKDDYFTFSGKLEEVKFLSIEVPAVSDTRLSFIGENKNIQIDGQKDSLYAAKVIGSPQTDYYNYYLDSIHRPTVRRINKVLDSIGSLKDTAASRALTSSFLTKANRQSEAVLFGEIIKHPGSYGLLSELNGISTFIPRDTARKYYQKFSAELKRGTKGKELYYTLFVYDDLIRQGKRLPDFSLSDTVQRLSSLSNFKGKYVLLDFWASWCGPCVAELPALKKIYAEYKAKGFEIVGISLDTNRKLWLGAIKEHNLTWPNFSDLKGRAGKVAELLQVDAIPMRFIIGPDGKILMINPPVAEVEQFLSQLK
ncbi:MAG: AhpC/TSA family protein [Chitinophaga sp.]|uniref:TlpA disulfide reductase family protein n=1 Tax=Chitinophaga sp. TaxID=1869181 RepID=UPI0025C60C15|nr:TlpA disulfide reductase family protein [Chitinophaga sp.]MBV8252337.1 AhpC/TSA family protein [Chitinophaga sp.]